MKNIATLNPSLKKAYRQLENLGYTKDYLIISFYKNYFKIGISGIIGGVGLGTAMITFIWSITNTTAAVTLLCLAAMPFFTALLAFLFFEKLLISSIASNTTEGISDALIKMSSLFSILSDIKMPILSTLCMLENYYITGGMV